MLKTLQSTMPQDSDYPARTARVQWLESVLNGTMYDGLGHEFHEERERDGTYIPLAKRRPSVRYNLCRIITSDSVSMLFDESHFPTPQSDDKDTAEALCQVVKDSRLNEVMTDAAMRGAVGSVAIFMRVLGNRVFFSPMSTAYLTPEWRADAPDMLASVTEQYKVRGDVLAGQGYEIKDTERNAMFWFRRVWNDQAETWFLPWLVQTEEPVTPEVDKKQTVLHGLGFVPVVWVKNLPGGDKVDGACTFELAIPAQVEIEYQLSQAGRGLKYSSDPLLMIKEPPGGNGELIKGANALVVNENGDAKLLEISGAAAAAVIEYARALRSMALETVGGNRADADKLSAAQSGRAMELMNQALIWLAGKLRSSYGEGALLDLLRMVVKAGQKFKLTDRDGEPLPPMNPKVKVSLNWPRWYAPTAIDRKADAETLTSLTKGNLLSQETAISNIADDYDVEDVAEEVKKIDADGDKAMERLKAISGPDAGEDDHGHMPMPKEEPKAAE